MLNAILRWYEYKNPVSRAWLSHVRRCPPLALLGGTLLHLGVIDIGWNEIFLVRLSVHNRWFAT